MNEFELLRSQAAGQFGDREIGLAGVTQHANPEQWIVWLACMGDDLQHADMLMFENLPNSQSAVMGVTLGRMIDGELVHYNSVVSGSFTINQQLRGLSERAWDPPILKFSESVLDQEPGEIALAFMPILFERPNEIHAHGGGAWLAEWETGEILAHENIVSHLVNERGYRLTRQRITVPAP